LYQIPSLSMQKEALRPSTISNQSRLESFAVMVPPSSFR
jgi:hypothetical protein